MLGIPSPDVLMNLFASAAQVMGLVVLCLSGGMLSRRRLPGAGSSRPVKRWPLVASIVALVATSAAFLLYHLDVVDQNARRMQTNLVRSSKEAGKAVGDTSLKTLDYSDQVQHPRAITTEQLAAWLAEGKAMNLIDVREAEEVEMGAIEQTWARRYPDLQANRDGLIKPGMDTILLCESGNRSSELSNFFAEQGTDTKFMIGGYEKWVAEGRPMAGGPGARDDLRAVPDFANKRTLLSTEEVSKLYLEGNALFVDVRYPKDFDSGHLPDAVNIALRKLRTDEAKAALSALPKRPIVAPCYDKRSSFYALILGVKLSRMGYDFRGRYTVPHEFALPQKESAWVAAWKAANSERTLFGDVKQALASQLTTVWHWLGNLALAIVLAALLLRIALAPLAVKAERDGLLQRRGAGELKAMKQNLAADPVRLRRAMVGWLQQNRITPGRNLVTALLQLLTFTAFFGAVDAVCAGSKESLLWLSLSAPDAYAVLPLLGAALLATIVLLQTQSRRPVAMLVAAAFVVGITALVWDCRAGVQLYLVVSFAALVAQSLLVRWRLAEKKPAPALRPGLQPLAAAASRSEFGGKASRLGDLVVAGFPVPPGFVVPEGYQPSARELDVAFGRLGVETVAVRSSARGEDGAQKSFAGEFRTFLGVGRSGLAQAIADVRASYQGRGGSVVVQALVPADHAGVMFTEDPAHAGRALVELVQGLGEGLVSGTATPSEHRFSRTSGLPIGRAPAFDLQPLLAMGRQCETLFGSPQDIEWARAGNKFFLLQSRNVTRRAGEGTDPVAVREAERGTLLAAVAGSPADEVVFAADDYAALLPTPTPYSLALMQELWAPGGSVDLASRRLGLAYKGAENAPPYVRSVFGRCYIDRRQVRTRMATSAVAAFRLGMASKTIEQGFCGAFLPQFLRQSRRCAAIDLRRLGVAELHEFAAEVKARFLQSTYVEAEVINLAAEAYVASARRRLERRQLDAAAVLGFGVATVVQQAFQQLGGSDPVDVRCGRFLAAFGHRAARDFELAEPRFREVPDRVAAMARSSGGQSMAGNEPAPALPAGRLLRTEVQRARRFQELKEAAKDAAMRELDLLRAILLELGGRHGLGELVFQLLPQEVEQLREPGFAAGAIATATERRRRLQLLTAVPLPNEITPAMLAHLGEEKALPALPPGALSGTRVAGDREVVGRVVVLHDPSRLDELRAGDILVVRCTDPCWMPAFRKVAGLVTEVGGWLSHAAIQAREHNLPAIVGAGAATSRLCSGEIVRLRRDGVIENLTDRRRAPRQPVAVPMQLRVDGRAVPASILDLTPTGAAIAWSHKAPPAAASLSMAIDGVEVPVSLAWTNCTRFGVQFAAPLSGAMLDRCLAGSAPIAAAH
jgi:rhodanese-related sulfurtransferase/membrane protein insertase Oxa1/YidC/SpoIIIJ/phosphohistidine swiveling domain-containing protein